MELRPEATQGYRIFGNAVEMRKTVDASDVMKMKKVVDDPALEEADLQKVAVKSPETVREEVVIEKKSPASAVDDVMGGSARWEVKVHRHGLVALLDVRSRFRASG